MVRFAAGQPGAVQTVEDLADDIRDLPQLSEVQGWAADVLERYRAGTLKTEGEASYWAAGTVKLARSEVPDFIGRTWDEAPEVSVRVSQTGQPECVAVCWYLHGFVAGPSQYTLSFQPWYSAQARPGIYAYHLYK
jgi:hypothetical protein